MDIKQKFRIFISLFLLLFLFIGLWSSHTQAAWHDSPIVYQQAVTKILGRGDISWGSKPDDYYRFGYVTVSHDGQKVLFTGACEFCDSAEVRPFLVNPDGTGLQDISDMLPNDITSRWSAWRNLIINDDGTKVFFRAVVEAGYYDDEYLYAYDAGSGAIQLAVSKEDGFSPFPSDWLFRIDTSGSRVYLDKYDAGHDSILEKSRRGLFYADTGAFIQWYLDVDDLPCESQCGNMNLFELMGVSARNDRAFFQWNSDYERTDGNDKHTRLYYTGLDGMPVSLTDEHWVIYEGDPRGITDTEGTRVIYRYIQEYGDPQKLALVDVASNTSKQVAWTSGLNGFDAHLSRSGRYALVNGEYGDHGTYYQTLIEMDTDTARDTWSYHFKMNQGGSTSKLTGDDRYYFYTIDGWPNSAENVGLYRIDTRTTGDDSAPYVQTIAFSAPALLDREDGTIAVQVSVFHPMGTSRIDSVTLLPLVEGQEYPAWAMGREPLAFPSGDPGSVRLYDDGTHGDVIAGDGIYTYDQIATRKNDRQEGGWNTWYSHYPLPADVGIRVVVRDLDNNYAVADTALSITDDPSDLLQTPDITILTSTFPNYVVTTGRNEKVYGTSAPNEITIASGANAELRNFPGQNAIIIQAVSSLFTVSRSGAMVTFTGSDGTVLKIPATREAQTISFNGGESRVLQIHDNQVMLDDLTVTTDKLNIPTSASALIQPEDLVYQGAFLFPENDAWAYSGHALAYYPPGNSLYTATHAHNGYVGEISIPAPVISSSINDLPQAEIRQVPADITGGWKDNCTFNPECIYRELDGLAYLPNINKMAWNLRDWYNTAKHDQDSLGWSNPDMTDAQGVWHIGERESDNDLFHNARTSNYLFTAPEGFAAQWLNNKWLIAGGTREAGALGGSQGPTLFALAPWEDGSPPASGAGLNALPLLYYPENVDCVWEDPDMCAYPGYRAVDQWNGGAWIETPAGSAIVITGKKGLGPNCYGDPEECGNDPCVLSKGYHAYPYQGQILFYDPEDIKAVQSGTRSPWQVLPYQVMSLEDISYMGDCTVIGAAAWDSENRRLFITEKEIDDTAYGLWGVTAVHVWQVPGK